MNTEEFKADVIKELTEMKRLGMKRAGNALKTIDQEDFTEYEDMSVTECATLLCELA